MQFQQLAGVYRFFKEALSEPSGTGSFSRISAGLIVVSVVTWISFLVFKNHAMPDLAGPSLFLSTGAGATYGVNKTVTALSGVVKDVRIKDTTTVQGG